MRERFRAAGNLDGFADHEVMEMLLYFVLPRVNTNEVAHLLLQRFGNIKSVLNADITELCEIEGIGPTAAEKLSLMGHVYKRIERESYTNIFADDIDALGEYLQVFYKGEREERLCAFSVNAAGKISACRVIAVGEADRVTLDIKELKRFLIYNKADSLLLTHNHPGGSAMPSDEDIVLTRNLRRLLGDDVRIMDHVIVGEDEVVSMRYLGFFRAFE